MRVFVPGDSAAISIGADEIAREILRIDPSIDIVRNGSRGALWLETLVEVQTPNGRIAYGPVNLEDVGSLFDADFLNGGVHPLFLGKTDEIAWLASQDRITFARVGIIDPLSLEDYQLHGGLAGLRKALSLSGAQIIDEVTDSGLRGRGGAGFPAGIKWRTVAQTESVEKYICCNADEGDSGTFADRMLIEGDPFTLIEGMVIAAVAVGATQGIVYVRSEYPYAVSTLQKAIDIARTNNVLGSSVLGTPHSFDIQIRVGAGSYVCGEEKPCLKALKVNVE